MRSSKKEPSLSEVYQQLQDWNWRFGETPEFSHHLETRFEWGTIDVYIDSENGLISRVKIFSDFLNPQVIDAVKNSLEYVTYDQPGVITAMGRAKKILESDNGPEVIKQVAELEDWLIRMI